MKHVTEFELPSTLGSEKIAMEKVSMVAESMGFERERIEDLKTAIAEACINAMEHGNKFDQNAIVGVVLEPKGNALTIVVRDQGKGIDPDKIPRKILNDDGFPSTDCGGLGMFLISNLANELFYETKPGIGNEVKMLFYLEH
jgi:serine/threonine-protein kinase RsbW